MLATVRTVRLYILTTVNYVMLSIGLMTNDYDVMMIRLDKI
jgi:hypothetical protein